MRIPKIKQQKEPVIDKVKSPFIRYSIVTVLSILIVGVGFLYLIFRTNTIYDISEADLRKDTTIMNTSVSSVTSVIQAATNMSNNSVSNNTQIPGVEPITGEEVDMSTALRETNCDNFCYTYEGWQCVGKRVSPQLQLRNHYYPDWDEFAGNPNAFDEEGFGKIEGRYVIAMTWDQNGGFATWGQKMDIYLENGEVINCVVGDIKSVKDATWTKYGHKHYSTDGSRCNLSVVEFCVNRETWYSTAKYGGKADSEHENPGTATCHPEWASPIVKIVKGDVVEY